MSAILVEQNERLLDQPVGDCDGDAAGHVVIAGARVSERLSAAPEIALPGGAFFVGEARVDRIDPSVFCLPRAGGAAQAESDVSMHLAPKVFRETEPSGTGSSAAARTFTEQAAAEP